MYSGIATKSDHPSYPLHAIIGADLRVPAAPHGAFVLRTRSALSAAMGAVCVCEPDRAAVVDRGPLPCVCGGVGAALTRAGKIPPHRPARPRPAAVGIAKARPRLSAPRIQAGPRCRACRHSLRGLFGESFRVVPLKSHRAIIFVLCVVSQETLKPLWLRVVQPCGVEPQTF